MYVSLSPFSLTLLSFNVLRPTLLRLAYRQPLLYNFSVAREFLKQVYVAERLQPPTSLSTITNAYASIWARASNPQYWREIAQSGEWVKVGVYAVEAYGIFKVSCDFPFQRNYVCLHVTMRRLGRSLDDGVS